MANIPEFKQLSQNYLDYWKYPQPESVRKLLGGELLDRDITNTCTVRLSHTMNLNGHAIPKKWGAVTNRRSKQGNYYIIRVKDFRTWMVQTFGKPDIEAAKTAGEAFDRKSIKGYEGIIGFDIGFRDATGHFDLWYGDTFSHEQTAGMDYFAVASLIQLWHTGHRWTSPEV
jgi:hypothetical protein